MNYKPWIKPRLTVDCGLCWVEKLPVLTLSNRPFKLIASVETFDRDTMFAAVVAEFFSKDCKIWKVKTLSFDVHEVYFYFYRCSFLFSMNFFQYFCSFVWVCSQQTSTHNRNQFMFASHLSACRHGNSHDVTECLVDLRMRREKFNVRLWMRMYV